MPRVVPSTVLQFIRKAFSANPAGLNELQLNLANSGELIGLLNLIEQIPDELLTVDGDDYASFVTGAGHIRQALLVWAQASRTEMTYLSRVPAYQQNPRVGRICLSHKDRGQSYRFSRLTSRPKIS